MHTMSIITPIIEGLLLHATAKALATSKDGDINVVPVSTIKVVDDTIWLVDYFMEKTRDNMQHNPNVSLVCRQDMIGYQIKGIVVYLRSGELFDQACAWVQPIHPDRTVQWLIVLKPSVVFDIGPAKNTEEEVEKILQ